MQSRVEVQLNEIDKGFPGVSAEDFHYGVYATEDIKEGEVATSSIKDVELDTVLSNSFGFGGTNASLAFSKYSG